MPKPISGAVDIGGTKIAVGLVDETGRVLLQRVFPTRDYPLLKDAVDRISTELHDLASQSGLALNGVGIGCTGQMDPEAGIVLNLEYFPDWKGAGLVQGLSDRMGVPVRLANDAEAAALGEWAFGSGQGARTFLTVTVGTGIGVAVLQDGRLWRGIGGAHPEIGHHLLDPSGPICFCGLKGCWESLAGGLAMEEWAQSQHPEVLHFTARELCDLARKGEPLAKTAVERTARYLGLGISNLVTIFTPDVIALGGGLMDSAELFLPKIESTVQTGCKLVPGDQVKICLASLGSQAVLIGASCLLSSLFLRERAG